MIGVNATPLAVLMCGGHPAPRKALHGAKRTALSERERSSTVESVPNERQLSVLPPDICPSASPASFGHAQGRLP